MRHCINNETIKTGSVLIVHPEFRSHAKKPYKVEVIYSGENGFVTRLADGEQCFGGKPHTRKFDYKSIEWQTYHKDRFEIIIK